MDYQQPPILTLNSQLEIVFHQQTMIVNTQDNPELHAKLANIFQKKAVREALEDAYPSYLILKDGETGQTLNDKYFQDIQAKIVKINTQYSNSQPGQNDSTSLNFDPTIDNTGCKNTSTRGCICHGACHGNCATGPRYSDNFDDYSLVGAKFITGHAGGDKLEEVGDRKQNRTPEMGFLFVEPQMKSPQLRGLLVCSHLASSP